MTCEDAARIVLANDRFLIVTHKNPDGDTVGSASALCHALRRAGKTSFLFPNTEINRKLMPFAEEFFAPEGYEASFYIATDVAAPDMQCRGADFTFNLLIDHHPTNPGFAEQNLIEADRSSCGEIVAGVIEAINGDIDKTEANLLYIAVSTDTGCFQYANTNENSFLTAAKLIRYGADSEKLNTMFFRKVSKARIMLEAMIYDGMQFYHDGRVVVALITKDMISKSGADESDLDDIASLVGRIESEVLGITVREMDNGVSKVSMRSFEEVDSSAICRYFGGGGHKRAAGCSIEETPQKAAELVLSVVDEVYR